MRVIWKERKRPAFCAPSILNAANPRILDAHYIGCYSANNVMRQLPLRLRQSCREEQANRMGIIETRIDRNDLEFEENTQNLHRLLDQLSERAQQVQQGG